LTPPSFDLNAKLFILKIKKPLISQRLFKLAEWTRLELATPGVTGRYSNQLNYHSKNTLQLHKLVGADGFEPPTIAL
jgi:hypothetical protein